MPTIVDSSGWIEYYIDGPNAEHFAKAIEDTGNLIVPSVSITEVFRWILRESSEADALAVVAQMKQGKVVPLDGALAVRAAETSHHYKLSLADGIIFTTALELSAVLLTQDADMEGLPGVKYFRHPERGK